MLKPFQDRQQFGHRHPVIGEAGGKARILFRQAVDLGGIGDLAALQVFDPRRGVDQLAPQGPGFGGEGIAFLARRLQPGSVLLDFGGKRLELVGAGWKAGQRLARHGMRQVDRRFGACGGLRVARPGRGPDRNAHALLRLCRGAARRLHRRGGRRRHQQDRQQQESGIRSHLGVTSSEWPVISAGFSIPIRASTVGATSARRPFSSFDPFGAPPSSPKNAITGTSKVVCAV